MNEFFEDLGRRFQEEASRRGSDIEAPTLSGPMAENLLDLARVVAQTSERRFAPLSSFLAGVAAERLRVARPGLTDAELADYVAVLSRSLEEPL